jgi:hypothetical protein
MHLFWFLLKEAIEFLVVDLSFLFCGAAKIWKVWFSLFSRVPEAQVILLTFLAVFI